MRMHVIFASPTVWLVTAMLLVLSLEAEPSLFRKLQVDGTPRVVPLTSVNNTRRNTLERLVPVPVRSYYNTHAPTNEHSPVILDPSFWGLDWSRKLDSFGSSYRHQDANVYSRNTVSSASNSRFKSNSPAALYSDIYRNEEVNSLSAAFQDVEPATVSISRFSGVPLHYTSHYKDLFDASGHRAYHFRDKDRFDSGSFSSASNSDNLSDFSDALNDVAVKHFIKNQQPHLEIYENANYDDAATYTVTNMQPIPIDTANITENSQPNSMGIERSDVKTEIEPTQNFFPEGISNDEIFPTTVAMHEEARSYLQEHRMVDGNKRIHSTKNSAGKLIEDESIENAQSNYEHILLSDFIDLNRLTKKAVFNSVPSRETDATIYKNEDGGKSIIKSTSKVDKEYADVDNKGTDGDDYDTIYIQFFTPNLRQKGSKLKGNSMNDTGDLPDVLSHDIGYWDQNGKANMEVIGNQIAAMNRIGEVGDTVSSRENVKADQGDHNNGAQTSTQINNINVEELKNANDVKDDFNTNKDDAKEVNVKQTNAGSNLPYSIEGRWGPAAVSQHKQLIPGYQTPPGTNQATGTYHSHHGANQLSSLLQQLPSSYHQQGSGQYQVAQSSGSSYANKPVVGNQDYNTQQYAHAEPFKQKYSGWVDVKPYQYSNKDPVTGAYSFGYGDPYQWRQEERRDDGVTFGGYGWLDEEGKEHVTRFIADRAGYRVLEPGQQIDFNVLPVYPPIKGEYVNALMNNTYQQAGSNYKEPFNTPQPITANPSSKPFPYPQRPSTGSNIPNPLRPAGSNNVDTQSPTPPSKPSVLTGSNVYDQGASHVIYGHVSQNSGTKGNQISSFGLTQQGSQKLTGSNPANPNIPPSVLNNLLQQVTHQHQEKLPGGLKPSISTAYGSTPSIPQNQYTASDKNNYTPSVSQTQYNSPDNNNNNNKNNYTPFISQNQYTAPDNNNNNNYYTPSIPQNQYKAPNNNNNYGKNKIDFPSNAYLIGQAPGNPFAYRTPAINDKAPVANVINVNYSKNDTYNSNKDGDKGSAQEQLSEATVATGRPPISYPLPNDNDGLFQPNFGKPYKVNGHTVIPVWGDLPLEYFDKHSSSDGKPWTSSVIRVQKPFKSQSLDYAFLTDDNPNFEMTRYPTESFDSIRDLLMDILNNSNYNIDKKYFKSKDEHTSGSGTDNKGGKISVEKNGKIVNASQDVNQDQQLGEVANKRAAVNQSETIGDYIGSVKWKIPVLGALDSLNQYAPSIQSSLKPLHGGHKVETVDAKNKQRSDVGSRDNSHGISGDHKPTLTNEDHGHKHDSKPLKSKRPPPPPPTNFFTELLRQMMMPRLEATLEPSV